MQDAIGQAAARHGVSPAALMAIARIESGLRPDAKNPASTAAGLFQQVDSNARQYGVKNRFEPVPVGDGAARFLRDNQNYLRKVLKREPTIGELYLAHQHGARRRRQAVAQPECPAPWDVVGADAVRLNGGRPDMTAGEFASLWTRKAGDASAAAAPVSGVSRRSPVVNPGGGRQLQLTGGIRSSAAPMTRRRAPPSAARSRMKCSTPARRSMTSSRMIRPRCRAAFDQLKEKQLGEHVPENIRRDYERGFDKVAGKYLRAAQKEHDALIEKQDRVASTPKPGGWPKASTARWPASTRTTRTAATLRRRKRRGSRTICRRCQARLSDAAEADKKSRAVEAQVQVQFHVSRRKARRRTRSDAMREQIRKDYAEGKTPLDAGAHAKCRMRWRPRPQQARPAGNRAAGGGGGKGRLDDRPGQPGLRHPGGRNRAVPRGGAGPRGRGRDHRGHEQILDLAKVLRTGPIADAEKKLDELRKKIGKAPTARQAAVLAQAEASVAQTRKSIATDLLGHAANAA